MVTNSNAILWDWFVLSQRFTSGQGCLARDRHGPKMCVVHLAGWIWLEQETGRIFLSNLQHQAKSAEAKASCHVPPFLWCADVMHWCTIVYNEMSHTVLRLEEIVPWLLRLGSTRPTSDTTVRLFSLSTIVICFAFDARRHALPHRLTQL